MNDAFESWLENHRDLFPSEQIEFVRSVYAAGYEDGYRATQHSQVIERINELEKKLFLFGQVHA